MMYLVSEIALPDAAGQQPPQRQEPNTGRVGVGRTTLPWFVVCSSHALGVDSGYSPPVDSRDAETLHRLFRRTSFERTTGQGVQQ